MCNQKPTKEALYDLYVNQRVSPEKIGEMYGRHGRTIRGYMDDYGIPRLGNGHLRKGVCAEWNNGLVRSEETRQKIREAKLGQRPSNYGSGDIRFNCEVCGIEVIDKPYRRKRTCSKACKDQLSSIYRGEAHWNYRGSAHQAQRNWSQYREWRTAVLSRGDYSCRACGTLKSPFTAHHLNNWAAHEDQRFDPDNGVCLCRPCHSSFHSECGQKFTTREMFEEWLTR